MIAEEVSKPATGTRSPGRAPSALIRKAAVLGAGTMGSRIAAHLANAGVAVVLLDIPMEGGARSGIAAHALDALRKSKPAAFFEPSLASRIAIGNFEDDLAMLRDCDWVIAVSYTHLTLPTNREV